MPLLLPLLHHPPLYYFSLLIREEEICLEQHDHYVKQTYRNRCRILGPNGVHTLSIPVIRKHGMKNRYRDVRIDYGLPWNMIHWKSLVAAYASSPYFEYMSDELAPFYEKHYGFLMDLNLQLLECNLKLLEIKKPIHMSKDFLEIGDEGDPREIIHPKKDALKLDPRFRPQAYQQVFSDRHGFRPDLSILDLMFNTGPESLSVLRNSLRT